MLQRWVLSIAVFMAFLPTVSYAAIPSTDYVQDARHIKDNQLDSKVIRIHNKSREETEETDTVAAGNDVRFDTVQIGQAPSVGEVTGDSTDRALIWIE